MKAVRPDAIVATGRSDYPNQVNNVLGFPYIFRGALDVRARTINEAMKIAAAEALAALAREDVPDEVALAYRGARPVYGPDYIIPVPFDPRSDQPRVRRGRGSGDEERRRAARDEGPRRLSRSSSRRGSIRPPPCSRASPQRCARNPKRVVFAEGEEESVIRAAAAFQNSGLGKALLVGRAGDHQDRHSRTLASRNGASKSACRIRRRKPRPISTRSTSACSAAARSIAIACAW